MARTVIYHAQCWDGFCAAWLCHRAWPDAKFVPANYGWTPPDVTDQDVLIVDFSYPRDVLLKMKQQATSLQVLDHHETAEKELAGLDFCLFDMKRSGARLTWDHLLDHNLINYRQYIPKVMPGAGRQVHWLVAYVEDRDLWLKRLPNTDTINAAIRSYPLDFKVWDEMMNWPLERLLSEGSGIIRYKQEVIDHHLKYLQLVDIDGIVGKGVSCSTAHIWSDIMDQILTQEPQLPFAIVWQDTIDGTRLYSLRTLKGGLNAGQLAKKLGGGGHANSAGFKLPIKTKFQVTTDSLIMLPIHTKIEPTAALKQP